MGKHEDCTRKGQSSCCSTLDGHWWGSVHPGATPNPIMEEIAPHLVHYVEGCPDHDARGSDGVLCSADNTLVFDFADGESSMVGMDPEVVQDEPQISSCSTPPGGLEGVMVGVSTSSAEHVCCIPSSNRSRSRPSIISEEHCEKMQQFDFYAKQQRTLHDLHIQERKTARYAEDCRAKSEEFLFSAAKRKAEQDEEFHQLQLQYRRERLLQFMVQRQLEIEQQHFF